MFRATRISMGGDGGDQKARSRSATMKFAERNEHDRAAPQPFKLQMASHGVHAARWRGRHRRRRLVARDRRHIGGAHPSCARRPARWAMVLGCPDRPLSCPVQQWDGERRRRPRSARGLRGDLADDRRIPKRISHRQESSKGRRRHASEVGPDLINLSLWFPLVNRSLMLRYGYRATYELQNYQQAIVKVECNDKSARK